MKSRTSQLFIFFAIFFASFFVGSSAFAATLYFYPQQISLTAGSEALIEIRLDTGTSTINAVELEGALSGVNATLRGITNAGSALDIFVEQPNIKGKSGFRLVGGVPGGLLGEQVVARLTVRGELAGLAKLSFDPTKTKVLLADGTGESAPLRFIDANVAVTAKSKDQLALTSESHPDQNQWYSADTAHIRFNFDPQSSYSYVVTFDPLEVPDNTPDMPEGTAQWDGGVKLERLPNGISYFAIKKIGSQSVSRYRLMNDTEDPEWVEINRSEGTIETEGRPFLTFLAKDSVSGVEYYEVRVNGGDPYTVTSPYPLPDAYSILSLRAYDRAGNFIEEFIPGPKKDYSLWVWAAIFFVLLVWVSGIISTDKRKK